MLLRVAVVMITHRLYAAREWETSVRGHNGCMIQGTHRARVATCKGRNVYEILFGDKSVGGNFVMAYFSLYLWAWFKRKQCRFLLPFNLSLSYLFFQIFMTSSENTLNEQ